MLLYNVTGFVSIYIFKILTFLIHTIDKDIKGQIDHQQCESQSGTSFFFFFLKKGSTLIMLNGD